MKPIQIAAYASPGDIRKAVVLLDKECSLFRNMHQSGAECIASAHNTREAAENAAIEFVNQYWEK